MAEYKIALVPKLFYDRLLSEKLIGKLTFININNIIYTIFNTFPNIDFKKKIKEEFYYIDLDENNINKYCDILHKILEELLFDEYDIKKIIRYLEIFLDNKNKLKIKKNNTF